MLQKLYDRCLDLARHKLSKPILAFVSFIESSFFPIPPDVMIVPMVLAKKEDYLVIVSPNPITHLIMPFVESIRILYSRFINKIYSNPPL